MKTLFDVTTTRHTKYLTGIQRVVVEFGSALSNEGHAVLGLASDDLGSKYQILAPAELQDLRENQNIGATPTILVRIKAFILGHSILAAAFHLTGITSFYRKMSWQSLDSKVISEKIGASDIEMFDSYLTADAFWNSSRDLARIISASRRGLKIGIVVHDVLPLTHSSLFRKDSVEIFTKNFPVGIALADNLFFVSEYTKCEFEKIFPENSSKKYVIDLGVRPNELELELSSVPKNPQIGPYAIMVGTIEPRKNYDLVIEVFAKNSGLPKLVIVGREGWLSSRTVRKIKELHGKIIWLDKVDDRLLALLVREADFGICASIAEGYGLPLREFVNVGLQTVASDIPPFRAINTKTDVIFFNPQSSESLFDAMNSLNVKKGFSEGKLLTWKDAAYSLSKLL